MKKSTKTLSLLLALVMILSIVPMTVFAQETKEIAETTEIPDGYTAVYNIEQLYCIRYNLDKNYILMADIDMTEDVTPGGDWDNGYGWAPIGEDDSVAFTGTFDGNGHTIKGMQIRGIKTNFAGLFGVVTGDIKNLTLDSAVITTAAACTYAGAVAAKSHGNFENITVTNLTMDTKSQHTAGVVAEWQGTSMKNVKVDGTITQNYGSYSVDPTDDPYSAYASGLIAKNVSEALIEQCINNACVESKKSSSGNGYGGNPTWAHLYTGGICGSDLSKTVIKSCFNKGNICAITYASTETNKSGIISVISVSEAGGIAGRFDEGRIENCYNMGDIKSEAHSNGKNYSGGIRLDEDSFSSGISGRNGTVRNCINLGRIEAIGESQIISAIAYGTIGKCYYLRETAPSGKSGTTDTATTAVALSEAQMKLKSVFGYLDFENTWFIDTSMGIMHPQLITNPEDVAMHQHTYTQSETAPTCTEDGYITYTCSTCGDSYAVEGKAATGHAYGEWTVTTPATCNEQGVETRVCANDTMHIETREIAIDSTNHDFQLTETVAPTCTEKGYDIYTCSRCNETESRNDVNAIGHTEGEWTTTVPATCTTEGTKEKRCIVCTELLATDTVPVADHTPVTDEAIAPTCTETGLTEGSHCSVCDAVLVEQKTVEALGHDYDAVISNPTCTEAGYTTHTCSRCKDSYTDSTVEATGHTEGEWTVTVPATLTSEGTKTLYCSVCKQAIRTETIPMLTEQPGVKSVSIGDMTLGYKSSAVITPKIDAVDGANYTVTYSSSNPSAVSVDNSGRVTSNKTFGFTPGSAVITVTVTDSNGNTVKDTCTVTVQFSAIQWIFKIVLFGWIWY